MITNVLPRFYEPRCIYTAHYLHITLIDHPTLDIWRDGYKLHLLSLPVDADGRSISVAQQVLTSHRLSSRHVDTPTINSHNCRPHPVHSFVDSGMHVLPTGVAQRSVRWTLSAASVCLFVCQFACLFVKTITSERLHLWR